MALGVCSGKSRKHQSILDSEFEASGRCTGEGRWHCDPTPCQGIAFGRHTRELLRYRKVKYPCALLWQSNRYSSDDVLVYHTCKSPGASQSQLSCAVVTHSFTLNALRMVSRVRARDHFRYHHLNFSSIEYRWYTVQLRSRY